MTDFKEYQHKIGNFLLYVFVCILLTIAVGFCAAFIVPPAVLPMIAKYKAKDPSNIKTGGCLMYKGYQMKSGSVYSLNGESPYSIKHIAIKNSPFERKWQSYGEWKHYGECEADRKWKPYQGNFYKDQPFHTKFKQKYKDECFLVDYVSVKLWWIEADYAYDVDKNFVCEY